MDLQTEKGQPDNLDLEFKKILCVIRQHIPYVNSNAYLMQCRLWLEKLSSSNENKTYRNIYLAELCKQILANKLLPPFNEAPPRGELKKLTRRLGEKPTGKTGDFKSSHEMNICSSDKAMSPQKTSLNSEQAKTNSISLINLDNWDTYIEVIESDDESPAKKLKTRVRSQKQITEANKETDNYIMSCGEAINNHSEAEEKGSLHLTNNKSKESSNDEDSWSDLTEPETTFDLEVKPTLDGERVVKLPPIIKRSSGDKEKKHFKIAPFAKIPPDIWQLGSSSTNPLEQSLTFLNDTNYISQDWKKTIAALQLRLSEMIQQNNELNTIIQKLERQSEHNSRAQNTQSRETHEESLFQLEQLYKEKIKNISRDYEKQISDIKKQNEETINRKENEVSRLSDIIQDQCLRIMNDISALKNQVSSCTCDRKVHVLKKCVSKMDKLFQRSEKEYRKQIDHLRQEMEIKESALQMQLKIQKADLVTQTRTGQKEEFEEILNCLEVKYIKMLEAHEHQIMKTKKRDDDTIQYLTDLLEKNGISYSENYFEYSF